MNDVTLQVFLLLNVFVIGVVTTIAIQQWREHNRLKQQPKNTSSILPSDIKSRILQTAQDNFKAAMDMSVADLKKDLHRTNTQLNQLLEKLVADVVDEEMKHYRDNLDALHRQNESTLKDSLTETTKQHIELKTKLIKRQAALDAALVEYQSRLETQLAEHQSDADKKLGERQQQLETQLQEQQDKLNQHQAELEAQLTAHQTLLADALTERQAKLTEYQTILESELTGQQTKHAQLQATLETKLHEEIESKKQFLAQQIDTKLADVIDSFLTETLGHNVDLGAQSTYLTSMLDKHKKELIDEVKE